ncbi:MAG: hypothetical protein U0R64_05930 [Candidatus Nanopelagicales bacterium]
MKILSIAVAGTAAAGLLLTGATAAQAGEVIKVGKGISNVKVGQSKKTVVRKLGLPLRTQSGVNQFGEYQILTYPHTLTITLVHKSVTNMTTESPAQRTRSGIGVGSTKQQLRRTYSVRCEKVATQRHVQSCMIGRMTPGEIVTDFRLRRNVVRMVGIGTVLD